MLIAHRYRLSLLATAALLAGCASSKPPVAAAPHAAGELTFSVEGSDTLGVAMQKLNTQVAAHQLHSCMLFWGNPSLKPADAPAARVTFGAGRSLDGWLLCGKPAWLGFVHTEALQPVAMLVWREHRLLVELQPEGMPEDKVVLLPTTGLDVPFPERKQHGLAMLATGDSDRDVTVSELLPAFTEVAATFNVAAWGISRIE